MAIQSDVYEGSSLSSRTFPSSKHIATKAHMAVWARYVATGLWTQFDVSVYQLINNSCVLDTILNTSTYDKLEIRVADAPDELTTSLSDIAVVASISSEITTVANSQTEVNTVADSIVNVNVASSNIDSINTASTNIADIGSVAAIDTQVTTVASYVSNVNTVATNIASVNTTATDIANVNTVASNILDVNSVATTIVPNIAEILLADDNAATATAQANVATNQASIATAQAVISTTQATASSTSASNAYTSELNAAQSAIDAAASAALAASYVPNPLPITLTGNITGVENSQVVITDTSYDANATYLATVNLGSVVDNSDGTYTVTLPDYSVATGITLTVVGAKLGYTDNTDTHGIAVTNTITADPVFTGSPTEGSEETQITLTNTAHQSGYTYTESITAGSIVDNTDGTFTVTLPAYATATSVTATVTASKTNDIDSQPVNWVITVNEVTFVADTAVTDTLTTDILNDGF